MPYSTRLSHSPYYNLRIRSTPQPYYPPSTLYGYPTMRRNKKPSVVQIMHCNSRCSLEHPTATNSGNHCNSTDIGLHSAEQASVLTFLSTASQNKKCSGLVHKGQGHPRNTPRLLVALFGNNSTPPCLLALCVACSSQLHPPRHQSPVYQLPLDTEKLNHVRRRPIGNSTTCGSTTTARLTLADVSADEQARPRPNVLVSRPCTYFPGISGCRWQSIYPPLTDNVALYISYALTSTMLGPRGATSWFRQETPHCFNNTFRKEL